LDLCRYITYKESRLWAPRRSREMAGGKGGEEDGTEMAVRGGTGQGGEDEGAGESGTETAGGEDEGEGAGESGARPGEEPHLSLLHCSDGDGGEHRVDLPARSAERDKDRALQLRQSMCYIGAFIAAGLSVGTTGPALPTMLKRIAGSGSGGMTRSGGGGEVGDSSLAAAFAFRVLGGLAGSIGGGAALVRIVPEGGHRILVVGVFFMALAPVILCYATDVSHVALAFILLDFGCGCGQVANTMMVWVNQQNTTQWLNVLNGSFGIGTLISPALVALLDVFLGSPAAAVEAALLLVPLFVFLIALFCTYIPSPVAPEPAKEPANEDAGVSGVGADGASAEALGGNSRAETNCKKVEADRWQWAAAVALTVMALNCAVGAETTFGTFLVSYVETQRAAGNLAVSEVQADLMTSFFWTAFTVGRFGSVFLERLYPCHPTLVIAAQIVVLELGWLSVALAPSSGEREREREIERERGGGERERERERGRERAPAREGWRDPESVRGNLVGCV
jgi:hypothetical protein